MSSESERPKRAAVYLRISQDRTGEALGIERQREDCERLLSQRGWQQAVPPFIENDTSASGRKPRPQFRALLAAVEAGKVDVIVAWALDRLTRNARDRLALVEACQRHGVIIALVRGSDMDPTSPAGRLAIGILGEVAQHEIDAKSDRQRRAVQQAAEQGRWVGGRRAFGYADNGKDIVESEAEALRHGYDAVISGVPLRVIAREWNAQGLRTAQRPWKHAHLGERSPWRADAVRRVLLNPRNAGIRALTRDGKREEIGPAEWEEIVPEETFRAAKTVLEAEERKRGGAGSAGRQLLTGLAYCAREGCGLLVHGGGAYHKKPIYRCRVSALPADQRPTLDGDGSHVNRLAGPVDDYVSRLVVARLAMPDARELFVDRNRADLPALRSEARALRSRLDVLAAEFGADPDITPGEFRAMRAPVRARLAAIEAQMADAARTHALGDLVGAEDVGAVWEALSVDRRRAVIDLLMEIRLHAIGRGTRTFRKETVEIIWRDEG